MSRHSVTEVLKQLQAGESAAGREIWQRYVFRLIRLRRRGLRGIPRRASDAEDVAIMAFEAFLRGVANGRYERLDNRDDLWQILVMLTERRSIEMLRYELADRRGGGKNRGESAFEEMGGSAHRGLDQIADPSPAAVEQFTLGVRMLLEQLNDETLCKVAIGKLEGYTNQEIGQKLGIALRSVERKLRAIRHKWKDGII